MKERNKEEIDRLLYYALRQNYWQFASKSNQLLLLDEEENLESFLPSNPDAYGQVEAREWLSRIEVELTSQEQKMFLLWLGNNLNQSEIAALLSCSRGNVCKALKRIRRKINQLMIEDDEGH